MNLVQKTRKSRFDLQGTEKRSRFADTTWKFFSLTDGNFECHINGMKSAIRTAFDASGRVVIPKMIRDEAQLSPELPLLIRFSNGVIEIVPEPRKVRIVKRGGIRVAMPREVSQPLSAEIVEAVRESERDRR